MEPEGYPKAAEIGRAIVSLPLSAKLTNEEIANVVHVMSRSADRQGMNTTAGNIRVLHSVGSYLHLTENWIYPQIVGIPGVYGSVFCGSTTNLGDFPLKRGKLISASTPPWEKAFGVPRFFNALGRRMGCKEMVSRLRIRRLRPQILHAHFGSRGWENLNLKRRLKIPLATSFYGFDAWLLPTADPIWRKRYQELFEVGDLFLVEGPAMYRRLCELGCPASKLQIQRIGVDLKSLPFSAKRFSHGLKVIMVGRFVEKKGMVDGLRACALARARGVKLTLTIVGDASTDNASGLEIKKELCELANGPELAGLVRFAGFVPLERTRALLNEHNLFLCPSKHAANGDAEGGAPVALTEAMATGLLCVGTRHCDIPEIILHQKTGLLSDEGDISELAGNLQAVQTLGNEAITTTQAGRKHVEELFSLQIQLNQLKCFYEKLAKGSV